MLHVRNTIIGNGTFAKVYETPDGTQAIKRIPVANEPTYLHWVTEISILNHFKHPKMPQIQGVSLEGKYCKIAMKRYCQLEEFDVTTISPELRRTIISDVGEVLVFMHHYGLIHTDVKRRNVLLDIDGTDVRGAILCDYGLVKATNYGKLKRGTDVQIVSRPVGGASPDTRRYDVFPAYNAYPVCSKPPEVVTNTHMSTRSDVWAFGCLAMALCSKVEGIDLRKLSTISQDRIDTIIDTHVDSNMKLICQGSMRIEPDERVSIEDMIGLSVKYSSKSSSLSNDLASNVYQTLLADSNVTLCNAVKHSNILIAFIHQMTNKEIVRSHIQSIIGRWDAKFELSEDCVLMCIHLILRYAKHLKNEQRTPLLPSKDIFTQVMICVNMGIHLFHPNMDIKLDEVSMSSITAYDYSHQVFCMFRLFDFNILE